jgi:recombination protein RecA
MSKVKKEAEPSIDIKDALIKKFGKVFTSGDTIIDRKQMVIPVSPAIDVILGGGIPESSFVVVTGAYKLGKTVLCLTLAANAQKPEFGNRKVFYFNVEARLKSRDLKGINGLKTDPEHFEVIGSTDGNIIYAEQYLSIFNDIALHERNSVLIIDSVSQLCSQARVDNDIGKAYRDNVPIMLADMTKRVSNILPINNNIVMCVTHRIANQSGVGMSKWSEASGQKVQYQADVKLKANYKEAYKVGEKQVGQTVHWECETSAIGPPGMKTPSLLRYGYGIDDRHEILSLCKDLGIVKASGAWINFDDGQKAQGMEKACDYLTNNPELFDRLKKQLHEVMYV